MMLRSFLPVGQGAFYCEQFSHRPDGEKVNIIYDCGSLPKVKNVERQIKNNFRRGEKIQALFISHLDDDHTNGIPFLLKYCKVENMFFPLVTGTDKKYLYIQHILEEGSADSFAMAFLEDPRRAFERFDIEYRPQLHLVVAGQQDIQWMDNRMDAEPVHSGTNVAPTILGNTLGDYNPCRRWMYVPYNFRQPERLRQFRDALNVEFGKNMDDEAPHCIWKNGTDAERRKIKNAYRKVKGSLNSNSMTLYSGIEDGECRQMLAANRCACKYSCDWKTAGCLYTGDYNASGGQEWEELRYAYRDYWEQIGCVQIPHHGSQHGYNTELAELNAYYVISAGMRNRYHHPHSIVIKDLLFHGQHPHIVTEHPGSALRLLIK